MKPVVPVFSSNQTTMRFDQPHPTDMSFNDILEGEISAASGRRRAQLGDITPPPPFVTSVFSNAAFLVMYKTY